MRPSLFFWVAIGLAGCSTDEFSVADSGPDVRVDSPNDAPVDGGAPAPLAVGDLATYARGSDGQMYAWGTNNEGVLGDGTKLIRPRPITVSELKDVVTMDGGKTHACGVFGGGEVRCWGSNLFGQLGVAGPSSSLLPQVVPGVAGAVSVTVGWEHSCALLANRTVMCWGNQLNGRIGNGVLDAGAAPAAPVAVGGLSDVIAIDAGAYHTCAATSAGAVYCWGSAGSGAVGLPPSSPDQATPIEVKGITSAQKLSCGFSMCCALRTDGRIKCWGNNSTGELGNGAQLDSAVPVDVQGITDATDLSSGQNHTCAIVSGGALKCWGANFRGEVGPLVTGDAAVAVSLPVTFPNVTGASAIGSGRFHTCFRALSKRVKCFGGNEQGQIGVGLDAGIANLPETDPGVP